MTGPLGNSEFCFPRISMFPETMRSSENKIDCSPRDQSLSVYYLISIHIRCVMLFYLASTVSEIGKFWSTANIFNLKGTSTCKTKMQIGWC